MIRSRFSWKLTAGLLLPILISAAIVGGLSVRSMEEDSREEIRRSLAAQATLLRNVAADRLGQPHESVLKREVRSLGEEIGTRLTVIDAEGLVLADSQEDPSSMDNLASRPEIMAVRSHGSGIATRYSPRLGVSVMHLALPIEDNGRLLGYARASRSLSEIDRRLKPSQDRCGSRGRPGDTGRYRAGNGPGPQLRQAGEGDDGRCRRNGPRRLQPPAPRPPEPTSWETWLGR